MNRSKQAISLRFHAQKNAGMLTWIAIMDFKQSQVNTLGFLLFINALLIKKI